MQLPAPHSVSNLKSICHFFELLIAVRSTLTANLYGQSASPLTPHCKRPTTQRSCQQELKIICVKEVEESNRIDLPQRGSRLS